MDLEWCRQDLRQRNAVRAIAKKAFRAMHPIQRRDFRFEVELLLMHLGVVTTVLDMARMKVAGQMAEHRHRFQPAT